MTTSASASSASSALRLLFEYEGDQVRLLDQRRVDMHVPDYGLPEEAVTGNFVDLRGPDGALVARVPIRAAMGASVEVFPEDQRQSIVRMDLPVARGAFTVVVRAVPQADHVTVVRLTADLDRPQATAAGRNVPHVVELGSFQLEGHEGQ